MKHSVNLLILVLATGSVSGNLRESFKDSGRDVVDMGRHLVTGTTQRNIHTGQMERRTSLFAAVPKLIQGIVTLDPIQGGKDFIEGIGRRRKRRAQWRHQPADPDDSGFGVAPGRGHRWSLDGSAHPGMVPEPAGFRTQPECVEPLLALVSRPGIRPDRIHAHRHPAQYRSGLHHRQHLRRLESSIEWRWFGFG